MASISTYSDCSYCIVIPYFCNIVDILHYRIKVIIWCTFDILKAKPPTENVS